MKKVSCVLAFYLMSVAASAFAGTATEPTQLANFAKLTASVKNELQMIQNQLIAYQNMVENTKILPDSDWKNIADQLMEMKRLMEKGEHIALTSTNFVDEFNSRYKDLSYYEEILQGNNEFVDMGQKYLEWSRSTQDAIRSAASIGNQQVLNFDDENALLESLRTASQTSTGRMQAIQAGNNIAAQGVQQMQSLRALVANQIQMQATIQAKAHEHEAIAGEARMMFFGSGTE